MMEILKAILVGIVQGLAEFLPISSSGHIELAQAILGLKYDEQYEEQFSVILHLATALSTIVIFRKDILKIIQGLFHFKWNEDLQFSIKIILSMIPAALVGYFLDEPLKKLFSGQILLVGCMLLLTGFLLFLADRAKSTNKGVSFSNSILIGIAQMVAILPGISRSGATISTSVLLGIDRTEAARFSFLMVLPLIFGKIAKDVLGGDFAMSSDLAIPFAAAGIAAFLTGIIACVWMLKLVKQAKLSYFSYYCFAVGLIAIVFSLVK